MSIASELNRIISAKSDIRDAIVAKGVSVPSGATIDAYADYVSQISGGGGGVETVEVSQCIQGSPYKLSGVKFDYEEYGDTKTVYYFTGLTDDSEYTGDCQYDVEEGEYFYIKAGDMDSIEFQFNTYIEGLYYRNENDGDWTYFDPSNPDTIQLGNDEKLYIKRSNIKGFGNETLFESGSEPNYPFEIGGNILSLLIGDDYYNLLYSDGYKYFNQMMVIETRFNSFLANCTNLVSAEHLFLVPFITVDYGSMFNNCSSLTTAPQLPATILGDSCYSGMFEGCTSLETAPELPATTLAQSCYQNMFYGCTSLNYIKCLATDISATYCTDSWVNNVAPSGTFVQADGMSDWQEGDDGYPTGWTVQNA